MWGCGDSGDGEKVVKGRFCKTSGGVVVMGGFRAVFITAVPHFVITCGIDGREVVVVVVVSVARGVAMGEVLVVAW